MADQEKTPAILDALGDPLPQKPQEPAIDAPVLQKIGYAANRLGELMGQLMHSQNARAIVNAQDRLREAMGWVEIAASIQKPK